MVTRVSVVPEILEWALDRSGHDLEEAGRRFPNWDKWLAEERQPTLRDLEAFSKFTGTPFGYFLLRRPPRLELPIADFREGFNGGWDEPSANLLAVLYQSIRRQEWYRDYALENDLPAVAIVGSGERGEPESVAAEMRSHLDFEVSNRTGSWSDSRKRLLLAFEGLGGLTVTTSMVGNNTHRSLDPDEFRGFSLVDEFAPLVFVNAAQTLNGQIFTLAHEFAHIWLGTSGISAEDTRRSPRNEVESWCNAVASEFLVPGRDLRERYGPIRGLPLPERLDRLASSYKCGTLVVLQALRRERLETFEDFDSVYDAEVRRLREIEASRPRSSGGQHYLNQPFRIGTRLSKALIRDALEGRTPLNEALGLMSMKSTRNFDEYARRLGAA